MKVLHVCFADSDEGGAIGAFRLHQAMLSQGVDSRFLAIRKRRDDDTVITPGFHIRVLVKIWNVVGQKILTLQRSKDSNYRSLNIFPTGLHNIINKFNADVMQFHWINRNTISISELTRINSPVVLKLPDMWAFSGTEHYLSPDATERYRSGYFRNNRQEGEAGLDIDRWIWRYKNRVWEKVMFTIVTPSKWLGECVENSRLFSRLKVVNIPNPIDLDRYRPVENKLDARIILGLPLDKKLILFGSIQANTDRRKGYHHLCAALEILGKSGIMKEDVELLIFGTLSMGKESLSGITAHHLGTIYDESLLIAIYNAADVMVLPTEADNLPNTIQEATACGTPCVGFKVGGMPDMIKHQETGYLANPFDTQDLATGIDWVLKNKGEALTRRVRENAERLFNPAERVTDYLDLYNEILQQDARDKLIQAN